MKTRIISLVFFLLFAAMMLTACGGDIQVDAKIIKESYAQDILSCEKLTAYDGYEVVKSASRPDEDGIVVLQGSVGADTSFRVYNLRTATDLRAVSVTYTAEQMTTLYQHSVNIPVTVRGSVIEIVKLKSKGGKPSYSYYTFDGETIAVDSGLRGAWVNDCLWLNGMVYRFDDEKHITDTYERSVVVGDIPVADCWNEDYYYVFSESSGSLIPEPSTPALDDETALSFSGVISTTPTRVDIYDDTYQFVCTYSTPSYAGTRDFYVFADGCVLIQYMVRLDDQAAEYDWGENNKKYDCVTLRLNPKNGKTEELDANYLLKDVQRGDKDNVELNLFGKVENLVRVGEFMEGRYDTTAVVIMDLNSKLKGDRVRFYNGESLTPVFFGGGHLICRGDTTGTMRLFDADGNMVSELNGAEAYTEKFILTEDAIYDYEFNLLCELRAGFVYKGALGNNLVFKATNAFDTYYLYDGGEGFSKIGDAADIDIDNIEYGIYGVKDENGMYTYYDASENQLFTSVEPASVMAVAGEYYHRDLTYFVTAKSATIVYNYILK